MLSSFHFLCIFVHVPNPGRWFNEILALRGSMPPGIKIATAQLLQVADDTFPLFVSSFRFFVLRVHGPTLSLLCPYPFHRWMRGSSLRKRWTGREASPLPPQNPTPP